MGKAGKNIQIVLQKQETDNFCSLLSGQVAVGEVRSHEPLR
jgi:hypothetical protein